MAELEDYELDGDEIEKAAGGECWGDLEQLAKEDCPAQSAQ